MGHALGLSDAYYEKWNSSSEFYKVTRREYGKKYIDETDNCNLMDQEETTWYPNDWEMAMCAYKHAVVNSPRKSFQAYTDYTTKSGDYLFYRSDAIKTKRGK